MYVESEIKQQNWNVIFCVQSVSFLGTCKNLNATIFIMENVLQELILTLPNILFILRT
jgi:hypothetical protein